MSAKELCAAPLTAADKARLLDRLDAICKFLNAPGDWGYGTTPGDLTIAALNARAAASRAKTREEVYADQAAADEAAYPAQKTA